ncbi:MAG: hypothetical protein M3O30_18255 [Planctomycetota bacterium]|nr:hypothetical protein [Planctomycetota bacterium]
MPKKQSTDIPTKFLSPYLCLGDDNFHDLCGGRENSDGIQIPLRGPGEMGTDHQSVLISGYAGTGKTTFAAQLTAQTLLRNNERARQDQIKPHVWPQDAQAIYYAVDQSESEIMQIFRKYQWFGQEIEARCFPVPNVARGNYLAADFGKLPEDTRESIRKASILIRKLPFDLDWKELQRVIENDVRNSASLKLKVKLITIDSLNLLGRTEDGKKDLDLFQEIISDVARAAEKTEYTSYSTIVIMEIDGHLAEGAMPVLKEEYRPDVVFLLNRERDTLSRRTIEIRKARGQHHLIGNHEFRIESQAPRRGPKLLGINVYPSIAARSRMIPETDARSDQPNSPMEFGVTAIDDVLKDKAKSWQLIEGSTTLLWGDPGTGKTDVCVRFLAAQWRKNPQSRVLFLTNKVDPRIIRHDLIDAAKGDEEIRDAFGKASDIEAKVDDRLEIIEASDPFRSHARIYTDVVNAFFDASKKNMPIRRAVIFGLGLIEETPEIRDHQWRFVSVLVRFLRFYSISTLLVDWPVEGYQGTSHSRPRASKLCGNEIHTALEEGRRILTIERSDYSPVGEKFFWDRDAKTWSRLPPNRDIS